MQNTVWAIIRLMSPYALPSPKRDQRVTPDISGTTSACDHRRHPAASKAAARSNASAPARGDAVEAMVAAMGDAQRC